MFNYSFWTDEAGIAGVAKQWVLGQVSLLSAISIPGIAYQKLQFLIVAASFKLFGISEFSARIPSMIGFILGIVVMFLIARKLSNIYGGVLASFLFTFSHLNLSYATQAKPYSLLETITLLVLFLIISLIEERKAVRKLMCHGSIVFLLFTATLLHTIGLLLWILYFIFLVSKFRRSHAIGIAVIFFITILVGNPYFTQRLFPYNFSYQVIKLFAYKYTFVTAAAILGFLWMFNKHRVMSMSILVYSLVVLILATFQQYIFNIRYVLSLFGILFLYFGIFWAKVGERYDDNLKFEILNFKLSGKIIIPLIVIILLYATGYKIIRWPQSYYNPNIDKYGDVQIANYKDFYENLKSRFPNYKDLYMVNDLYDTESWYLARYSNAYFAKSTTKSYIHHTANAYIYGSLDEFKKIIKINPHGLLVMEDWESFLPDDIKDYAKKNLRLEFRVESLNEAQDDPWPLALYSWGFKENPKP